MTPSCTPVSPHKDFGRAIHREQGCHVDEKGAIRKYTRHWHFLTLAGATGPLVKTAQHKVGGWAQEGFGLRSVIPLKFFLELELSNGMEVVAAASRGSEGDRHLLREVHVP